MELNEEGMKNWNKELNKLYSCHQKRPPRSPRLPRHFLLLSQACLHIASIFFFFIIVKTRPLISSKSALSSTITWESKPTEWVRELINRELNICRRSAHATPAACPCLTDECCCLNRTAFLFTILFSSSVRMLEMSIPSSIFFLHFIICILLIWACCYTWIYYMHRLY